MISRNLLEYGLLRQMDVQNSMYPEDIPKVIASDNGGIPPLQLSKYVADNFPVLIKNSNIFNGLQLTEEELRSKIGHLILKVAETPYGNAGSPVHGLIFVKPHISEISGDQLFDLLANGKVNKSAYYMQSQDGNLSKEFKPLLKDIPESLAFANDVFNEPPEAVNVWIGSAGTTSRLHNDNYDNLFAQITGKKIIYLIPPGDAYCLDEKFLVPATYSKKGSEFVIEIDGTDTFLPTDLSDELLEKAIYDASSKESRIMFPTVDPSDPSTHNHIFRIHCKVYRVAVEPGDILFIPALWYHQVEIDESELSVSVNYWYPASPLSPVWARWDYVRLTSALLHGYHDAQFFDLD